MKRLALLLLGFSLANGCSSSPATQLTVGVLSQIQVPKDLKSIRITLSVNGALRFCQTYPVDNGMTVLPQSLAIAPEGESSRSVLVSVVGFEKDAATVNDVNLMPDNCGESSKDVPSKILRRSLQPYISAKNIYVPMPLRYSCYGVECKSGETCRGGKCVSPQVDINQLPQFTPEILFGTTNTCFDVDACLGDAVGPTVVDAANCIYEVPPGSNLREVGMNVRAIYEKHGVEVLDIDREEGFTIPDPTKPNRFQLADGLCHPSPGARRIVNVNASRTCASKNVFQPLCASSGKPLAPATSALYVVMDKDTTMSEYVGPTAQPGQALDQVLRVVLGDPVFSTTTDVALRFVPDAANTCTASYDMPDQAYQPVWAAANPLSMFVRNTNTTSLPQLAADKVLGGIAQLKTHAAANRRAIMLVTNRDPSDAGGLGCGSIGATVTSNASQKIDTWILSLRNSNETLTDTNTRKGHVMSIAGAKVIAAEGPGQMESQLAVVRGLADLVSDLAACVYDAPGSIDIARTDISFKPPAPLASVTVPFNAGCNATSSVDGWNVDTTDTANPLVRICGNSCTQLKSAITIAAQATALRNATGTADGQQVLVSIRPKR